MAFRIEDEEEYSRGQTEYWRKVDESEGFDIEDIRPPQGTTGLMIFNCKTKFFTCPYRVNLYAKLGLYHYNALKGTNFQLEELIKYNSSMNCVSTYYITLVASDLVSGSVLTFQVKVQENRNGRLDLTVPIARPKGSTMELRDDGCSHDLYNGGLCEWPSEEAFVNGLGQRFEMGSELQDLDWVRLFLELVLCSKDRELKACHLSKLKILKVAIETVKPPRDAIIYITFRLASYGISEHVERRAIVRTQLDEHTGKLVIIDALTPFSQETGANQMLWRSFLTSPWRFTSPPPQE